MYMIIYYWLFSFSVIPSNIKKNHLLIFPVLSIFTTLLSAQILRLPLPIKVTILITIPSNGKASATTIQHDCDETFSTSATYSL